jgi:hypothetical protein
VPGTVVLLVSCVTMRVLCGDQCVLAGPGKDSAGSKGKGSSGASKPGRPQQEKATAKKASKHVESSDDMSEAEEEDDDDDDSEDSEGAGVLCTMAVFVRCPVCGSSCARPAALYSPWTHTLSLCAHGASALRHLALWYLTGGGFPVGTPGKDKRKGKQGVKKYVESGAAEDADGEEEEEEEDGDYQDPKAKGGASASAATVCVSSSPHPPPPTWAGCRTDVLFVTGLLGSLHAGCVPTVSLLLFG